MWARFLASLCTSIATEYHRQYSPAFTAATLAPNTNHTHPNFPALVTLGAADPTLPRSPEREEVLLLAGTVAGTTTVSATSMPDTGATANFMDADVARRAGLTPQSCRQSIALADGTLRPADGVVRARCRLSPAGGGPPLEFDAEFIVTSLTSPRYDVILGMPWLRQQDARIDFVQRTVIAGSTALRVKREPVSEEHRTSASAEPVMLRWQRTSKDYFARAIRRGDKSALDLSSIELIRIRSANGPWRGSDQAALSATSAITENPRLRALLEKHKAVMPDTLAGGPLPDRGGIAHRIELTPGARPSVAPLRRYSLQEQAAIDQFVEDMLAKDQIQESTSPWGAMVLLARKKDGSMRFCVDYRALNNVTVKNRYALPLADDCFDRAVGATVFSKLDLHSGFWQIPMDPESRKLTAFRTRQGHYEFKVLPMGLCNAPATFMSMMNTVLRDMMGTRDGFVLAFLDDIFIFSRTEEEHLQHLDRVLTRLAENKLFLKPSKCEWMRSEVEFLGHRIGREGLTVDPDKVRVVRDWAPLQDVADVRSFLGLAGFYRRFIPDFGRVAAPLTELTKETVAWRWGDAEQRAFAELKRLLTEAPVLALADPSKPFVVYTDASGYAIGAALMQDQGRGLQPVSFLSAKMSPQETRYPVHEQELLALVYALKHWRYYLMGGTMEHPMPFTVLADHRTLQHFPTQPQLSARQARWKDMLAEMNFTIKYIEGPKNVVADALSRRRSLAAPAPVKETGRAEFLAAIDAAPMAPRQDAPSCAGRPGTEKDVTLGALMAWAGRKVAAHHGPRSSEWVQVVGGRGGAMARRRAAALEEDHRAAQQREAERERNRAAAEQNRERDSHQPAPNRQGAVVMPTQRCTAPAKRGGQCKGKTAKGQYCYWHRRLIAGTRITKSPTLPRAGQGLVAVRDFAEGDVIADYTGDYDASMQDGTRGGPYYLQLRRNLAIDAARTNAGDGRWANDPRGTGRRANAELRLSQGRARLVAKARIRANDEILVSYGAAYWRFHNRGKATGRKAARAILAATDSTVAQSADTLRDDARAAAAGDPEYGRAMEAIAAGEDQPSGTVADGLIWRAAGTVLVLPNDKALRTKAISLCHDTPVAGHFGRERTLQAVRRRFEWVGMASEIERYVASCDVCQRVKPSNQRMPGLLRPLPVPDTIDSHWQMDFYGGLPRTARGHDTIQLHVSRGGAIVRVEPTTAKATGKDAADVFIRSVVRNHGMPASVVSDRDKVLLARFFDTLFKRLGLKLPHSTAYHAATDGKSERALRTTKQWMKAFCDAAPKDWDLMLPLAELALNSQPGASGVAPFELLYGRVPADTVDRALHPTQSPPVSDEQLADVPAAKAYHDHMRTLWDLARGKLLDEQKRMERLANRSRRDVQYEVGDLVLLSTEHLRSKDLEARRKLSPGWAGPFPVTEVINPNAYKLSMPDAFDIHPVINVSKLRSYVDGRREFPTRPQAYTRPPAEMQDSNGAPEWTVERVLSHTGKKGSAAARYLVLWKGYPYEESTWEPAAGLDKAQEAVDGLLAAG